MAWANFQRAFYDKVWPSIQQVAATIGVDPRIIFAQAALESNWGRSELTRTANNFFGIKARSSEPYVIRRTREVIGGASVYVNARFREYGSVLEGLQGYGNFITRNPRYGAFRNAQGLDAELAALQASGYATDPQYSTKLRRVINNMPSFQNSGTSSAPNTASVESIVGAAIGPFNPLLGDIFSGFGTEITEGAVATISAVASPFDWVKDIFSIGNGVRVISVILGIALVIVAIIVLANSSDSLKLETPLSA